MINLCYLNLLWNKEITNDGIKNLINLKKIDTTTYNSKMNEQINNLRLK